jgi:RimJ/RimL family protein N-acetyltransferase
LTSPEVRAYLGGPRARDEVERTLPDVPKGRPGLFMVDLEGLLIGIVTIERRDPGRPGHVRPDGLEAELSYVFLQPAWGYGYASEACVAAIEWFAETVPGEPLVLCTQVANERAIRLAARLGFTEAERFEEHGAQQWFGVWSPVMPG